MTNIFKYHRTSAIMALATFNGLLTSILLEMVILLRSGFDFAKTFKTAIDMSFISMIAMEIAMNSTDCFFNGWCSSPGGLFP